MTWLQRFSYGIAQEAVDLLCHKGPLVTYVQHIVNSICQLIDPEILLCRGAFQLASLQHILVPVVIPADGQDFKPAFAELRDISDAHFSSL